MDVLIDDRLHVWLLEVNLAPAFPPVHFTNTTFSRVLGMVKIGLHYKIGSEEERKGDFPPYYRIYDESDSNFTYYINKTEYE